MEITWRDARGQVKTLRAKCLDLAAEGARLETDAPIPSRTKVTLHAAAYGSLGSASVRHCVRQTLRYHIGVEFTSAISLASDARRRCLEAAQSAPGGRS